MDEVNSRRFVELLSSWTGIEGLLADDSTDVWGGNIDFWTPNMSSVLASGPVPSNAGVLFNTPGALHEFPGPPKCPATVARKSMQFYYYMIDEGPAAGDPGDR